MTVYCFNPSTKHPPALSADDDAAAQEKLPWVLLELHPYLAKRENATTAYSNTWDGKEIQVTLCPRRPPRVSYLCLHSPCADIAAEPEIIATEDDLIVFRVPFGSPNDLNRLETHHYFVYQANDGSGRPSLKHLPRLHSPCTFDARDMGILRYHSNQHPSQKEFIVTGIYIDPFGQHRITLFLYDSGRREDWTTHTVSMNHHHQQQFGGHDFFHKNCKVMAIGDATMAFVDLWRGILLCDVRRLQQQARHQAQRKAIPVLSYVPVPSSIQKNRKLTGDARLWRNIAVFNDRLKYVELVLHKKNVFGEGCHTMDGWMAATFSRSAALDDGDWSQDCYIDSNETDFSNDPHLKLLPKPSCYQGKNVPPFKGLHIRQPVLGLQEGADIIYFTIKVGSLDACVVGMDMRKKTLLGVSAFKSRFTLIDFNYIHGRISKYLMRNPPVGISNAVM